MSFSYQELEVKYSVSDLRVVEVLLKRLAAACVQPRVLEVNLRFDTPQGDLTQSRQVLRLRQDDQARLTYKSPGSDLRGVHSRQEIEFAVSDFHAAQAFLEALGYQVVLVYEKYRTTYRLDDTLISLDEMPYGGFVEVEGPGPEQIRAVSRQLGLDWEKRILESYINLFNRLRDRLGLSIRDLSFENFRGMEVAPEALGVAPADSLD